MTVLRKFVSNFAFCRFFYINKANLPGISISMAVENAIADMLTIDSFLKSRTYTKKLMRRHSFPFYRAKDGGNVAKVRYPV